tara:strand:+ start:264 stop:1160 length:897 start_codon:yes stop_codon:yes gene_type:complete
MFILVTGASGQVGKSIKSLVKKQKIASRFVFVTRDQLDLSSLSNIQSYFKNKKFDLVINCAAYTKVDKAEIDKNEANIVNHLAVKKIAEIAKDNNFKLIHISTDFVFDGLKSQPYIESDIASPLNIYGKTKLAGENAVLSAMKSNAIIIRTSWVYSEYRNNFVDTILRLIQKGDDLNVVCDQVGTPTYAADLAEVILNIIASNKFMAFENDSAIYHFSNEGECSWYDFAKEIIKISEFNLTINPINTEDYLAGALRPMRVLMRKEKISKEFSVKINFWKDSLKKCMKKITEISSPNSD